MKTPITDSKFYEVSLHAYEVVSEYIFDNHREVELLYTEPRTKIEVNLEDCYIDEHGDLYVPVAYDWVGDSYIPKYGDEPTLTKLKIINLIAEVQEPDLNNPANFAN